MRIGIMTFWWSKHEFFNKEERENSILTNHEKSCILILEPY